MVADRPLMAPGLPARQPAQRDRVRNSSLSLPEYAETTAPFAQYDAARSSRIWHDGCLLQVHRHKDGNGSHGGQNMLYIATLTTLLIVLDTIHAHGSAA